MQKMYSYALAQNKPCFTIFDFLFETYV